MKSLMDLYIEILREGKRSTNFCDFDRRGISLKKLRKLKFIQRYQEEESNARKNLLSLIYGKKTEE